MDAQVKLTLLNETFTLPARQETPHTFVAQTDDKVLTHVVLMAFLFGSNLTKHVIGRELTEDEQNRFFSVLREIYERRFTLCDSHAELAVFGQADRLHEGMCKVEGMVAEMLTV